MSARQDQRRAALAIAITLTLALLTTPTAVAQGRHKRVISANA